MISSLRRNLRMSATSRCLTWGILSDAVPQLCARRQVDGLLAAALSRMIADVPELPVLRIVLQASRYCDVEAAGCLLYDKLHAEATSVTLHDGGPVLRRVAASVGARSVDGCHSLQLTDGSIPLAFRVMTSSGSVTLDMLERALMHPRFTVSEVDELAVLAVDCFCPLTVTSQTMMRFVAVVAALHKRNRDGQLRVVDVLRRFVIAALPNADAACNFPVVALLGERTKLWDADGTAELFSTPIPWPTLYKTDASKRSAFLAAAFAIMPSVAHHPVTFPAIDVAAAGPSTLFKAALENVASGANGSEWRSHPRTLLAEARNCLHHEDVGTAVQLTKRAMTSARSISVHDSGLTASIQETHLQVIARLCVDGRAADAYVLVNAHKYLRLKVTNELISSIVRGMARVGDSRAFNLVDVCTLFSGCRVDLPTIGLLFETCAVYGDHHRARTMYSLLADDVPGVRSLLPPTSVAALAALHVVDRPVESTLFDPDASETPSKIEPFFQA